MTDEDMLLFKKFKEFLKQQDKTKARKPRRSKGTGSIYKNTGSRKKPYTAVITIGKDDETGAQHRKLLGTYESYQDAENALALYDLHVKGMLPGSLPELQSQKKKTPTFKDIWEIVWDEEIIKLSISAQKNYKTAFNNLSEIHSYSVDLLNMHILQPIFDRLSLQGAGYSKLNNMKVVINKVSTYSMKYDYINKNYSEYITFEKNNERTYEHFPFTHEEIKKLWKSESYGAKLILIYIFTGMRPIELINMKNSDIHINESYMIGGAKTDNGKNRIIPIHRSILPLIEALYDSEKEFFLLNENGNVDYVYNKYRSDIFKNALNEARLNLDHMPYDTRHTFATLCNEKSLDEFLVKKIMGHSINDITKGVYTHVDIKRLVEEVNKLDTFC